MQQRHPPVMTALDQAVSTQQGQLLKAALPYLPASGQELLSVYAKMLELTNTMALFSSRQRQSMQICEEPQKPVSPLLMLNDMRRFCTGQNRRQIDQMVNLLAMVQMLELFQN